MLNGRQAYGSQRAVDQTVPLRADLGWVHFGVRHNPDIRDQSSENEKCLFFAKRIGEKVKTRKNLFYAIFVKFLAFFLGNL